MLIPLSRIAAAALHVSHPLAHLPLVPAAARGRGRDRPAAERRSCCASSRRSSSGSSEVTRAAQLRRRAVLAAHPHPHGRRAAESRRGDAGPLAPRAEPARGDDAGRACRRRRLRLRRHRGGAGAVEGRRSRSRSSTAPTTTCSSRCSTRWRPPGLSAPAVSAPIRHVAAAADEARQPDDPARPRCSAIDVAGRQRHASTAARRIAWDHLIVAAGATHSYFGHDDWAAHAPGLKTLADALRHPRPRHRRASSAAERGADAARAATPG